MSEIQYMELDDGWLAEELERSSLENEILDVLFRLEKHELEKLVKTVREIVTAAKEKE